MTKIKIKGCGFRFLSPYDKVLGEIENAVLRVGSTLTGKTNTLYPYVKDDRATVLIPKSKEVKAVPWTKTSGTVGSGIPIDTEVVSDFGALYLPRGVKSVTLNMSNTSFYYGLLLMNDDLEMVYDSNFVAGGNQITHDTSAYNKGMWLFSAIKMGSEGTDVIPSSTTLEDLGWSINVEY